MSNDIINVGSEQEITVLSAASIISQHKNKNIIWNTVPGKQGSVTRRKPSLDKLLKYYPMFSPMSFEDAVKDL